ncbi:N-acetylneuraminate synthase family protein [Candidatus Sororendozoicomonas aggregata]|uniref:N-acetylneuraminate synthase family protein n=1 Tax=Candidatus Sororendozoicomonas aggregata TaxID=3073239 RepID=UPI002ED29D4B
MSYFYINDRKISSDTPPLVIAEIGINHGGSLKTAFEMVDAAASAGAEIIKHQTHVIEDEMSASAKKVIPGNADISIYEIMERCALNEEDEIKLQKYTESKGLLFISTPFSRAGANRLHRMGIPAYKIGSGECNNYPLIEHIIGFGKPIILSTGMNSIGSIKKAVNIIENASIPYALLHCTNVYPTPPELIRLGAITEMRKAFPKAVLGLSDHSTSNHACFGAVALGACILERHFTDSMNRLGPDIECSMDSQALRELIEGASIIQRARGGRKEPLREEKPTIDFAFATVVATKTIEEGEMLTEENTWVKRPGTGEIPAEQFKDVLGTTAKYKIFQDQHISYNDLVQKR